MSRSAARSAGSPPGSWRRWSSACRSRVCSCWPRPSCSRPAALAGRVVASVPVTGRHRGLAVAVGVGGGPGHDPLRPHASTACTGSTEPRPGLHVLTSGTTIHGRQTFDGPLAGEPLSYYHRAGPLGEVIESLQAERPTLRIGAVGLGAGAIAAYGRPGDSYPVLRDRPDRGRIARDPASFTYLADSAATIEVDVGDGRLGLESVGRRRVRPARARCLLVGRRPGPPADRRVVRDSDAHSRDRVGSSPSMSRTASSTSSRSSPRRRATSGSCRSSAATSPPPELTDLADASQWVIIGRSFADLAGLVEGDRWRTAHADARRAWTDRYSDLLGALRD